jgi:hypothetical protein
MKRKISTLLCFVSFSVMADDPSIKYEELYRNNTYIQLLKMYSALPENKGLSNDGVSRIAERDADLYARCHMNALMTYTFDLQDSAFDVANSGGSYADSKQALESAIAVEMVAGGEREERVNRMLREGVSLVQQCLDHKPVE